MRRAHVPDQGIALVVIGTLAAFLVLLLIIRDDHITAMLKGDSAGRIASLSGTTLSRGETKTPQLIPSRSDGTGPGPQQDTSGKHEAAALDLAARGELLLPQQESASEQPETQTVAGLECAAISMFDVTVGPMAKEAEILSEAPEQSEPAAMSASSEPARSGGSSSDLEEAASGLDLLPQSNSDDSSTPMLLALLPPAHMNESSESLATPSPPLEPELALTRAKMKRKQLGKDWFRGIVATGIHIMISAVGFSTVQTA